MIDYLIKASLKSAILCIFLGACSTSQSMPQLKAPTESYAIKREHKASGSSSLYFSVKTPPFSYKYIDIYRSIMNKSGFELCSRSAISKWQVFPGSLANNNKKSKYWLVEVYSKHNDTMVAIIRVEQSLGVNGAIQKFSIAQVKQSEADVGASNIQTFCEDR